LGVSVSTPSFWKRGAVVPNPDNLDRICEVYRLDRDEVWKLARMARERKRDDAWAGKKSHPATTQQPRPDSRKTLPRADALELNAILRQLVDWLAKRSSQTSRGPKGTK